MRLIISRLYQTDSPEELNTVGTPTEFDRWEGEMNAQPRDLTKLVLAFALWAAAVVLVLT